jgi:hypothetical protein
MENAFDNKFSKLPANLQAQVVDFIDFLLSKEEKKNPPCKPKFGSVKGMFKMHPDFDEPLEDFKDYM